MNPIRRDLEMKLRWEGESMPESEKTILIKGRAALMAHCE